MFFKKKPINKKKDEIAQHVSSMSSWPMSQVDMEPPTGRKARGLVEAAIGDLEDERILKYDSYVLAMAALVRTAQNAFEHDEIAAACMLCVAVLHAVGGRDGLTDEETQAVKVITKQAHELLEANHKKMKHNLSAKLLINTALNGLNQGIAKELAQGSGSQNLDEKSR